MVEQSTTSVGKTSIYRVVEAAPPVTTTTNPTETETLKVKPRTHQLKTRNNTPGALPPIMNPVGLVPPRQRRSTRINRKITAEPFITKKEPNSSIIPMAHAHIISQQAVKLLTSTVYKYASNRWIPNDFITDSPTVKFPNAYDVDLEHLCALVVHPITG